ncbi:uncharacterized protein TRIADDRAFT_55491 [Trichoplax adhaerens]|uniref:Uncharacterized protein n=1 Tax=Trichoplax adhaerens TaxID=10228 RepID=B3RV14_TRIAD|nr:predicted protein [Trichoplax adhaerens]EDV25417.1 predicted protein [Trichoplax adhaerens]|eukprot:XP_002111450.1 predicted protein [Trichoplax adhaerens]
MTDTSSLTDEEYLDKYKIRSILQTLFRQVLHDRPSNPISYFQKCLQEDLKEGLLDEIRDGFNHDGRHDIPQLLFPVDGVILSKCFLYNAHEVIVPTAKDSIRKCLIKPFSANYQIPDVEIHLS